ncbi:hypothetical protein EVAR_14031_1 [Eumeta japonica]|uniref:Uncharacterized protein n=1 Tax=Eumeta variegata TaxID=151549 RepID=A0A4C1XD29_EUMVA|nr:hypothetical protein EVAR_14031_1 [Eumeta japonica]
MTQQCDVRSMEKKLSKNDNLKREYCEQINNLLKMGTQSQRRINLHPNACGTCLFHSRTHPQKKSALSLMRPARTNGKCLNDALLTGPDLIRSLLGVLVRFRQGRVAVSADIKGNVPAGQNQKKIETATIPVAK